MFPFGTFKLICVSFLASVVFFSFAVYSAFADTPQSIASASWLSAPVNPPAVPPYAAGNSFWFSNYPAPGPTWFAQDKIKFNLAMNQVSPSPSGVTAVGFDINASFNISPTQLDTYLGNTCSSLRQTYNASYQKQSGPCWFDWSNRIYSDHYDELPPTCAYSPKGGVQSIWIADLCNSANYNKPPAFIQMPPICAGFPIFSPGNACYGSGYGGNQLFGSLGELIPRTASVTNVVHVDENYPGYVGVTGEIVYFQDWNVVLTVPTVFVPAVPYVENPNPPSDAKNVAESMLIMQEHPDLWLSKLYGAEVWPQDASPLDGAYDPLKNGCLDEVKGLFVDRFTDWKPLNLHFSEDTSWAKGEYDYMGNHWNLEDSKLMDFSLVTTLVWSLIGVGIIFRIKGKRGKRRYGFNLSN